MSSHAATAFFGAIQLSDSRFTHSSVLEGTTPFRGVKNAIPHKSLTRSAGHAGTLVPSCAHAYAVSLDRSGSNDPGLRFRSPGGAHTISAGVSRAPAATRTTARRGGGEDLGALTLWREVALQALAQDLGLVLGLFGVGRSEIQLSAELKQVLEPTGQARASVLSRCIAFHPVL